MRMGLGRLVEAWSKYGIQMLVLISLVLQLLLFILPIVRRHKMLEKRKYLARLFKLLLWLAYQLADTTAIYVLGHMAISSSLSGEVMALWASLVLVHLGGQDTMTAYSLEDNRLWKRHLLTLLVQAAGVVYVLYGGAGGGRSSGPYPRLRVASALMFVVGFLKFAERIWVLRASDMNKLFTRLEEPYKLQERYIAPRVQDSSERAEEDLKQAHELLYFCMCQFVDFKVSLSPYQKSVIKCYAREKRLSELVHLQLSLMHDMLYTKAAAIHTRCGFLLRLFSWLATATTCTLVFLSGSSYGGRRLDAAVTRALVAGAFLLETASSLRAAGSTWTYQILRSGGWCGLGRVVLEFRWLVRAAEWSRRRCPGYIGGLECRSKTLSKLLSKLSFQGYESASQFVGVALPLHLGIVEDWLFMWSAYGRKDPNTSLFVDEIEEMVTAYIEMDRVVDNREKEKLMNSRGGLSLPRLLLLSGRDGGKVKLIQDLEQLEFDEYLVLWYYATKECAIREPSLPSCSLFHAIRELSNYMMYLFKKQPHMLPPPVRQKTCPNLSNRDRPDDSVYQNLVNELDDEGKLKAVLWVWIEMLCYAASHCIRESHARELSNGSPELATVLWVVRAALINANMKPAVSTADAASVGDKSPVATEGNNVITHRPSSVPPVLDTNRIGNHRRVFSV